MKFFHIYSHLTSNKFSISWKVKNLFLSMKWASFDENSEIYQKFFTTNYKSIIVIYIQKKIRNRSNYCDKNLLPISYWSSLRPTASVSNIWTGQRRAQKRNVSLRKSAVLQKLRYEIYFLEICVICKSVFI